MSSLAAPSALQLPAASSLELLRHHAQAATPKAVAAVASQRRRMSDSCIATASSSPTSSASFRLRVARAAQSPARPRLSGFGLSRAARQGSSFVPFASGLSGFSLPSKLAEAKSSTVAVAKNVQDSFVQVLEDLTPPSQISSQFEQRERSSTWLIGLFALTLVLAVIMVISAFAATPDMTEDCQWFPGVARTLQVSLTSWLMFAAGALLALEHPVKMELLRSV